jgi:hypothetical protein
MATEKKVFDPYAPKPTEKITIITYDTATGITDADKAAAEELLGKVVWFSIRTGARVPSIAEFTREIKEGN